MSGKISRYEGKKTGKGKLCFIEFIYNYRFSASFNPVN